MSAPREVPRRRKRFNYRRLALTTAGLAGWTCLFTGALYQSGYLDYLWRRWPTDPRDPRMIAEYNMREDRKEKMLEGIGKSSMSASKIYKTLEVKEKGANTEGMKKLFTSEGFDETKMEPGLYGDVVVSKSARLEAAAATETDEASSKTAESLKGV